MIKMRDPWKESVQLAQVQSKLDRTRTTQLCSSLGGGCKAPFTDQQISSAASNPTSDQSKAITNNFGSALSKVTSDPTVTELVTKTVGSKVPGILASLF
jgi:hypothetical protein